MAQERQDTEQTDVSRIMLRFTDGEEMIFPSHLDARAEIDRRTREDKPQLTSDVQVEADDLVQIEREAIADWFVDFGEGYGATFEGRTEVSGDFVKTTAVYPESDLEVSFLPEGYGGMWETEMFTFSQGEHAYFIEASILPRPYSKILGNEEPMPEDLRPLVAARVNEILQK